MPRQENKKTLVAAFRKKSDLTYIEKVLSGRGIRIIGVGDVIALIESLDQHRVNLIITEYTLGGVSALSFVPFIQRRYPNIKIIVVMRRYSPDKEIELRQKNVMYVMPWPANIEIIKSVVDIGLESFEERAFYLTLHR